jgi:hypothetical protein
MATRVFSSDELNKLGLPGACKGGTVLEDRFVDEDGDDEIRFVIFNPDVNRGEIWGVSYTKREDGGIVFDEQTKATQYVWQPRLVQAGD